MCLDYTRNICPHWLPKERGREGEEKEKEKGGREGGEEKGDAFCCTAETFHFIALFGNYLTRLQTLISLGN